MLIDSHVNLHAPQFDDDREAVIQRARDRGVARMVNICDRVANFDSASAVALAHEDIWVTAGTHPHHAADDSELESERLVDLARRPKVVAIGETGLDFHYEYSPREAQERAFRVHIEAARRTRLPLVVHTREADEATARILEEEHGRGPFKILMHCYTSGPELAARAAALGAWFSVSGIATFKTAADVRERIAEMPAGRIILETDCPYLAPAPMRGRRNEPSFLPFVLAELARVRGWSLEEAESRTQAAFFELFDAIPGP